MFPDDQWNVRDRYLDDRQRALDARERLLDAREHRLATFDRQLTIYRGELVEWERRLVLHEMAAEQRQQVTDEREAIADIREQQATIRERILDERALDRADTADPGRRIGEAFAREVARLDRSDALLHRSRRAVARAEARLDKLRSHALHPPVAPDPTAGETGSPGPTAAP